MGSGLGFRVLGLGSRVSGLGSRALGFGMRGSNKGNVGLPGDLESRVIPKP